MNKLYLSLPAALALAAGFAGGLLSRYIAPERVFAQTPAPAQTQAPAQPVRASSFVLLDAAGRTAGVFAFDKKDARPNIVLFDEQGKVIWDARHTVLVPLTQK
ncbi:MAG TPA: hypothetical protein VN841_25735 [Bryobacteraceae bacterium]|nr:hypothetical protein [Bryobacteraceae bacterium]